MAGVREATARLITPDAVYGTILFAALVAATSGEEDHVPAVIETLVFSLITQAVFWVAHLFAGAVAGHGKTGLRAATVTAARHSLGLLYAPVLPSIPLLLGIAGVIDPDTAVDLCLLVAMLILGVLGFLAFAQRGSGWIVRILGALGSAFLGFVIIILNAIVH